MDSDKITAEKPNQEAMKRIEILLAKCTKAIRENNIMLAASLQAQIRLLVNALQ